VIVVDESGQLRREVGPRARYRRCRRPFPAGPLPNPACSLLGTGLSTCLVVGQPLVAAAGFGLHGVGMVLPR
jgi:hypothetical protein